MNKVDVLDKGYVILHDVLGSYLTVANAARVSYDKRTEELTEKDEGLIRFLAKNGHTSPFRHAQFTEVDSLDGSPRGGNGFGSTGVSE